MTYPSEEYYSACGESDRPRLPVGLAHRRKKARQARELALWEARAAEALRKE